MKKVRLSVYLQPEIITRLTELADRKKQPKSLIAEAAITSFLTPDNADQLEAALATSAICFPSQTATAAYYCSMSSTLSLSCATTRRRSARSSAW